MRKDSVFNYEQSYLNSWYNIRKGFEEFFKENNKNVGINPAEVMFLSKIYYKDGISQREIANILNVSEANITKTFKKLETKELVYKTIDENNNARRNLHLTEKGEDVFETSIEIYEKFDAYLFEGLNEDQIKRMEEQLYMVANRSLGLIK